MFNSRSFLGLSYALFITQLALIGCADFEDTDGAGVDGVMPLLEPTEGELIPRFRPDEDDFYRVPWPSDARLHPDGGVDVGDIPTRNNAMVRDYVEALRAVKGYSTLPVVYIPFEAAGSLEDSQLPSPAETLEPEGTVQLIELSEQRCGERTPLEVKFEREGGDFMDAQTLQAAPMPGWVLRADTPYALVVTTSFGGAEHKTARGETFTRHLNAEAGDPALIESFELLRECLPKTDISPELIAVATVFSTQDPPKETRLMREVVWGEDTPIKDLELWARQVMLTNQDRVVYRGEAPFPIFQEGEPPYDEKGGLVFGDDGLPTIQRWETVPFLVVVPPDHPGPLNLLIWQDGTGAAIDGSLSRRHWLETLKNGFAIATFAPQFHKYRKRPNEDEILHSFNFFNPTSGRTVFRQQAAETSYFIRLLKERVLHEEALPPINTDRIFYGGHSQGALVGSLVAGVEPLIDTYVFSGVSAYLSETILSRKEPFDIVALLKNLLKTKDKVDRFHPIVQFAQTGADVVDTQNYAPYWRGWDGHPSGSDFLLINGQHDDTTSVLGMNALMTAGDISPVGAPGWDISPDNLRAVSELPLPVKNNQTALDGSPLTIGAILDADTGHFTLFEKLYASDAAINFWKSAATGDAVIEY